MIRLSKISGHSDLWEDTKRLGLLPQNAPSRGYVLVLKAFHVR